MDLDSLIRDAIGRATNAGQEKRANARAIASTQAEAQVEAAKVHAQAQVAAANAQAAASKYGAEQHRAGAESAAQTHAAAQTQASQTQADASKYTADQHRAGTEKAAEATAYSSEQKAYGDALRADAQEHATAVRLAKPMQDEANKQYSEMKQPIPGGDPATNQTIAADNATRMQNIQKLVTTPEYQRAYNPAAQPVRLAPVRPASLGGDPTQPGVGLRTPAPAPQPAPAAPATTSLRAPATASPAPVSVPLRVGTDEAGNPALSNRPKQDPTKLRGY